MSKIVFEMITLRLQHIMTFIFRLPSGSPIFDDFRNVSGCDLMIAGKRVRGLQINRIPVKLVDMEQGIHFFAQKR